MKKVSISDRDIDNIMSGAIDSACGYWRYKAVPKEGRLGKYTHQQISKKNGTLLMYIDEPVEEGGSDCYALDRKNFMKGLEMYIDYLYDYCMPFNKNDAMTINTDESDDCVCDAIIQYALFGKMVFG